MGEFDITVERLHRYAEGLGLDELALRLIALTVWEDGVERTTEERVAEVRRRLLRAAGV
jgi:hypothetical protein